MFIHWGIYSIPGWHEQHQWRARVPRAEYVKLAEQWNPVRFNPDEWLDLMEWLEESTHWMCYDPAKVTERTLREHLTEIRQGQPRWLAVGDVAARYHVGVGTVAQWREKGILPMVRYGNYWVRESELDGFVPPAQRSLAGIPKGQRRVLDGKDGIRTEAKP